jgi:hypothetical protein
MTFDEKEALYIEYEKSRTTIRSDKDDFLEKVVESIEMMPNLLKFRHKSTKYDEPEWEPERRGLRFCEDDDDDDDYYDYNEPWAYLKKIEHDIDSLRLALFLRALGSTLPPKPLKTISFEIHGPGFWTPSRLRHLWKGCGHGKIRRLRKKYRDAAIADQKSDRGVDDGVIKNYPTQLCRLDYR